MGCLQAPSSLSSESSHSLESVRSKSSESATATQTVYGNGGGSSNASLVGGVVGGVLGAAVIGLLGILLWRRNRAAPTAPSVPSSAAPSSTHRPFFGQQPSSLPITPASQTFLMSSDHTGVPTVTNASQAAWYPQQLAPVTLQGATGSPTGSPTGPPNARQNAPASRQTPLPPYSVSTWADWPPTTHQGNHGGYGSQPHSSPAGGFADPRESYSDAFRGSTSSVVAPINDPFLALRSSGSAQVPAATYPFTPPASEKAGSRQV